MSTQTVKND